METVELNIVRIHRHSHLIFSEGFLVTATVFVKLKTHINAECQHDLVRGKQNSNLLCCHCDTVLKLCILRALMDQIPNVVVLSTAILNRHGLSW